MLTTRAEFRNGLSLLKAIPGSLMARGGVSGLHGFACKRRQNPTPATNMRRELFNLFHAHPQVFAASIASLTYD